MKSGTLCTLLSERIDPKKFKLFGIEIEWLTEPTADDLALAADVIANYDTLAAAHQAQKMKQQAIDAIQAILDTQAKALGFDSVHTAAVWTISKNEARKARADALVAWADSMWDFAEAEWEKQGKGESTFKTVDEFLAGAPKFPGVVG
jgi:hypothetical protein